MRLIYLNQSVVQLYQTHKNFLAVDKTINISKYNHLAGSSYIKLNKIIRQSKKKLINIQNIDENEYFKWCLFRYLHHADNYPAKIGKADKDFETELDFKNI